ncbi:MAG: hypothetical protein HGA67_01065 [Candidatus Yonathbacteria bacterium]|nr:hypothetical protein [Candidatus Yonathbacteria bacterium]
MRYNKKDMEFFGKKKKQDVAVVHVYDIGSASVGGAIVLLRPDTRPLIVYATRKEMTFQEAPDSTRLRSALFSAVGSVAQDLEKNGTPLLRPLVQGTMRPRLVSCTLASPWYASQTRRVRKEYKHPMRIKSADIKERAEEEYNAFVGSPAVQALGSGDHVLIEQRIIQVKLNGYETGFPEGKDVSSLDMTIVFSVTSADVGNGILEAIEQTFPDCPTEFNTFPLISFDAIRAKKQVNGDLLCVDISGEVTDVSLVDDGVLLESVSFPVGKRTMLRDIAHTLGVTNEEAFSLVHLKEEKGVVGTDTKRVTDALAVATATWSKSFEQVTTSLGEGVPIPGIVYLMSDPDSESWLSNIIGNTQEEHPSAHLGMFRVIPVNVTFLNDVCDVSRESVRDPFLMLEAIFAEHLVHSAKKRTHIY